MKSTRRQFGMMATASAAGLMVPTLGRAQVGTNAYVQGSNLTPPENGKNWHPLAAQRPHNDILSRLQGIMQREGFDVLLSLIHI